MAITVAEIFERVRLVLQDEVASGDTDGTRWKNEELIDWYNEGLMDMVTRVPSILPSVDAFECVPGARQAVPADRIAIIHIGRNLGPAAKPRNGSVPLTVPRTTMDRLYPEWEYASTSTTIQTVIGADVLPNDIFWVFPPQPSTNPGRLQIIFSKRPTVVVSADADFELDDKYSTVMIEYLLYRAFLKDAENQSYAQRSAQHLQNYIGLLGGGQVQG